MQTSNDRNISHFKRSKVHMHITLRLFNFFALLGRIPGQIKSKFYEARWYAFFYDVGVIDLMFPRTSSMVRRNMCGSNVFHHRLLLQFDKYSIVFLRFKPLSFLLKVYMLFFYNLAYLSSMLISPSCAKDIYNSSENKSLILLGNHISGGCLAMHGLYVKVFNLLKKGGK